MSLLFGCGLCCMLLSIWAILQLIAMGFFFKMEVVAFIEEAEPDHHAYEDFDDFMEQTKKNYQKAVFTSMYGFVLYVMIEIRSHIIKTGCVWIEALRQMKLLAAAAGVNCWVAAAMYVLTLGLSYICIKKSQASARLAAERIKDDEIFCREKAKKL